MLIQVEASGVNDLHEKGSDAPSLLVPPTDSASLPQHSKTVSLTVALDSLKYILSFSHQGLNILELP